MRARGGGGVCGVWELRKQLFPSSSFFFPFFSVLLSFFISIRRLVAHGVRPFSFRLGCCLEYETMTESEYACNSADDVRNQVGDETGHILLSLRNEQGTSAVFP